MRCLVGALGLPVSVGLGAVRQPEGPGRRGAALGLLQAVGVLSRGRERGLRVRARGFQRTDR